MRSTIIPTALLALLAAVPAAQAQEPTTLAELERPSEVREYGGAYLYSDYDPAIEAYRLTVGFQGSEQRLPVEPSQRPFDADLGTDTNGRLAAILAVDQPEGDDGRSGGTDLFVHTVGTAAVRPVTNANTPDDEGSPTIWRGTIGFSRQYSAEGEEIVYTKRLVAPRSRPSTRQPGVPDRRCELRIDEGTSCATTMRAVSELELYGRRLGQIVTYGLRSGSPGFRHNEVRLVDVEDRSSRLVDDTTTGLSGQTFVGASFAAGRLSWYLTCGGDPAACRSGTGAFRYDYADDRYELAEMSQVLSGYAYGNEAVLRAQTNSAGTCGEVDEGFPGQPCRIVSGPLDFEPVADRVE